MKTATRRPKAEYKVVMCSKCDMRSVKIETTSKSGICWLCVTRALDPPKVLTYKPSGRPRGWQFMNEYAHTDGTVYHKGVEQPKLKGTMDPTKVDTKKPAKKRITKKEKQKLQSEAGAKIFKLKKELAAATTKVAKRKITSQIKKLEKLFK